MTNTDNNFSLGFDGMLYQNDQPYNGWYGRMLYGDAYYVNGKCVAVQRRESGKFIGLCGDELEFNSREEVERTFKLLAFI